MNRQSFASASALLVSILATSAAQAANPPRVSGSCIVNPTGETIVLNEEQGRFGVIARGHSNQGDKVLVQEHGNGVRLVIQSNGATAISHSTLAPNATAALTASLMTNETPEAVREVSCDLTVQ